VFSLGDSEAERALQMRASLDAALASAQPCPPIHVAIVGAYVPLHILENAPALLERTWPQGVRDLIVQQVEEPLAERRIASTIPILTAIDDEVSRAVREQYEESPYPRWVQMGPATGGAIFGAPAQGVDVLIAGCGTGLSTLEFARNAPRARILAVDLSRSSLSYAKRMAQTLGIANVEFAHGDITRLEGFGRDFDCIDASGVLHHLADPWAGWRILLSLLRPGGSMQVGLYSQAARRNVVAGRALIAQRGYRPIPADIHRCREEIAAAEDGSLLKSLTRSADFFTMSECRDLLFHPQEHRLTLPEIKAFVATNDLQFCGFALPQAALRAFAARFPGPTAQTDLDCWAAFEKLAPNTFGGMYLFSVQKRVRN